MNSLGKTNIDFYEIQTLKSGPSLVNLKLNTIEMLAEYLISNPDKFIFYGKDFSPLNVFKTPPLKTPTLEVINVNLIDKKVSNIYFKYTSPNDSPRFLPGSRNRFIPEEFGELNSNKIDNSKILNSSISLVEEKPGISFFYKKVAIIKREEIGDSMDIRGVNISNLRHLFSEEVPYEDRKPQLKLSSSLEIPYIFYDFILWF